MKYEDSVKRLDKAEDKIKMYEQMDWKDHFEQSCKLFWSK